MDFILSKEEEDIKNAAREFALGEFPDRAQEFDREEKFDPTIWKKACELGFVAVHMKEEYGGAGLGMVENCLITEEFWAVDAGMANACLAVAFGCDLIDKYGTEEQKTRYITPITTGQAIMGTAITEPDAGSDVAGAVTMAARVDDGYRINGSKTFITNGSIANYLLVFCLTDPDNPDRHKRHSFFMVETDRKGFEARKLYGKLGIRANDTAEISFSELEVPASHMIGQEGEGFKQIMYQFNVSRIRVAAQAVGLARAAFEEAMAHITRRHQFGSSLASFQANQFKIAEMATQIEAARNLYYKAAWFVDRGTVDHGLIAMAKWFSGEVAVRCADEALQMHGGYGYIDEYKIQRIYRDAKIVEIYEGTKEIEKIIVARSFLRR
jgi:alkylation response protein AidB-like acyl-CoA dehydrogenase